MVFKDGKMKRTFILGLISVLILASIFSGCDGDNTSTTSTQSQTTESTRTIVTLETPVNIEIEYEITDNYTKGLLALYEVKAVAETGQVYVSAVAASVKIARSYVTAVAEFYDADGNLMYTNDTVVILNSVDYISSTNIMIRYFLDDPLTVARCKLYVSAIE
jgi:hypothetical protein